MKSVVRFLRSHWERRLEVEFISEAIGCQDRASIIDIGCGIGYDTLGALRGDPSRVIMCDISSAALKHARRIARDHRLGTRIHVVRCRAEMLPFKHQTMDLAILISALEHFDSGDSALLECRRVLRQGGHIALTADSAPGQSALRYPRVLSIVCKANVRRELKKGLSFGEVILGEHARTYRVNERHDPVSLGSALSRAGFADVICRPLVRSLLGRSLFEASVSFSILSFDTRNPAFRLLSRLYPLIERAETTSNSSSGYVVAASATAH